MQAGVCLRQDTEAALPELTDQHRIRQKEEELSGLESVHMAESETECAAPGLNALEPECDTAHSGISDVHHTQASLIKTETDMTHAGDIKTENLDSMELEYVTHLHPDQIKTEPDDGGYADHISDLRGIICVDIKSNQMKCESSEILVSDLMDTVKTGSGVDHKDPAEPWQCSGEPNQNCKKEEIHDMPAQCGKLSNHCDMNNENNQTRISQKRKNGSKPYMCTQCKKGFSTNSALIKHLRIHTGERPYRCTQCEKCFSTKYCLDIHQRIHTGEKPYSCIQCGKCFSRMSNLRSHQRIHSGEKPYVCFHCEKCFSTISNLSSHQRVHTGEKPYRCAECEKCFSTKFALNVHLRIHSGEKPYKCAQCEKCFNTKFSLDTHLRNHTGEKPYKCTKCGSSFSRKSCLDSHQRIHTGEKPYKCHHCGKLFSRIHNLNIHQRIHTSEKPYKCSQCGNHISRISQLNSHQRNHTDEKTYKCAHCVK